MTLRELIIPNKAIENYVTHGVAYINFSHPIRGTIDDDYIYLPQDFIHVDLRKINQIRCPLYLSLNSNNLIVGSKQDEFNNLNNLNNFNIGQKNGDSYLKLDSQKTLEGTLILFWGTMATHDFFEEFNSGIEIRQVELNPIYKENKRREPIVNLRYFKEFKKGKKNFLRARSNVLDFKPKN
jgi:hypothetical protein